MTPRTSPTEHFNLAQSFSDVGTQTITEGANTATIVLSIPPINIEIVPNPDITRFASPEVIQSVVDKASSVAINHTQLMWIQQSVDVMMSRAELVNNLHPTIDALAKAYLITNLF